MKKEWVVPVVESLDVSETMAGVGTTLIDDVTVNDKDIYDPPLDS